MLWIYALPLWLLAFIIVTLTVVTGLLGVAVVRHQGWMLNKRNATMGELAHNFIGVLYAVALGLMAVNVQSGYSDVETVVMHEANLAGDLYRDAERLKEPFRSEIRASLRTYLESVIQEEWPLTARGGTSEATWNKMDDLLRAVLVYEPGDDGEQVVFAEIVSGVNDMLDQRRERLHLGNSGIGFVTWSVVLLGAFLTISVGWVFYAPGAQAHYWLVGAMSAMFGLMIFLIVAMDYPLRGDYSVTPTAFEEVLENLDRWDNNE